MQAARSVGESGSGALGRGSCSQDSMGDMAGLGGG